MNEHVIVLGGGVAGMSAAHELIERGFRVTVYEKGTIPGGKARSFGVTGTGKMGRRDLPAEHGFRFFPGFYRHLPDTMKRIPHGDNREGVFDNLVDATQMQILFKGNRQLVVPSRFPRSLRDVTAVLSASGYLTTAVGLAFCRAARCRTTCSYQTSLSTAVARRLRAARWMRWSLDTTVSFLGDVSARIRTSSSSSALS